MLLDLLGSFAVVVYFVFLVVSLAGGRVAARAARVGVYLGALVFCGALFFRLEKMTARVSGSAAAHEMWYGYALGVGVLFLVTFVFTRGLPSDA